MARKDHGPALKEASDEVEDDITGDTPTGNPPRSKGTMATIRATCNDCGDVELTTADVHVRVNAVDHQGTYAFTCPRCATLVVKPAESRTIDLLLASGVAYELCAPPIEIYERQGGPAPISSADLDAFHSLLSDDDDLWAAFEEADAHRGLG
jgi:hypothetical protein